MPTIQATKIDVGQLASNFSQIKNRISDLEFQLRDESKHVDKLLSALIDEVDEKNKELEKINAQQIKLQKEVEQYKTIASLSKKQADAVTATLQSSKYTDYLVGLLVGVLSGLIVSWLKRRFLPVMKKQTEVNTKFRGRSRTK